MNQFRVEVESGQKYVLPSGRRVVVLQPVRRNYEHWGCAYLNGEGAPMKVGSSSCNRVTLTAKFLCEKAIRL